MEKNFRLFSGAQAVRYSKVIKSSEILSHTAVSFQKFLPIIGQLPEKVKQKKKKSPKKGLFYDAEKNSSRIFFNILFSSRETFT